LISDNKEAPDYQIVYQIIIELKNMNLDDFKILIMKSSYLAYAIFSATSFIYSVIFSFISLSITHTLIEKASLSKTGLGVLSFLFFDFFIAICICIFYMLAMIVLYEISTFIISPFILGENYEKAFVVGFGIINFLNNFFTVKGIISNPDFSNIDYVNFSKSLIYFYFYTFKTGWRAFFDDLYLVITLDFF
jgi:hypothetical protein